MGRCLNEIWYMISPLIRLCVGILEYGYYFCATHFLWGVLFRSSYGDGDDDDDFDGNDDDGYDYNHNHVDYQCINNEIHCTKSNPVNPHLFRDNDFPLTATVLSIMCAWMPGGCMGCLISKYP